MSYLETALRLINSPPGQEEGKVDQGVVDSSHLNVEGREYELNEIDEISPPGLNSHPPPIGYGDFDLDEVAWAERWNDRMGVVDPIYRKLNCWMWLASSYLADGNREMAIKARDEYHGLRHSDESITEKCGLCEYGVTLNSNDSKKS